MRRLIFVLMIALLPLHSWAADVMAVQMMRMAMVATDALAKTAPEAAGDMSPAHAACMERMGASMNASISSDVSTALSDASTNANATAESCNACQSCHTLAISAPAHDLQLPALRFSSARIPAPGFASAERALSRKPPIS